MLFLLKRRNKTKDYTKDVYNRFMLQLNQFVFCESSMFISEMLMIKIFFLADHFRCESTLKSNPTKCSFQRRCDILKHLQHFNAITHTKMIHLFLSQIFMCMCVTCLILEYVFPN